MKNSIACDDAALSRNNPKCNKMRKQTASKLKDVKAFLKAFAKIWFHLTFIKETATYRSDAQTAKTDKCKICEKSGKITVHTAIIYLITLIDA